MRGGGWGHLLRSCIGRGTKAPTTHFEASAGGSAGSDAGATSRAVLGWVDQRHSQPGPSKVPTNPAQARPPAYEPGPVGPPPPPPPPPIPHPPRGAGQRNNSRQQEQEERSRGLLVARLCSLAGARFTHQLGVSGRAHAGLCRCSSCLCSPCLLCKPDKLAKM
jgi:hypothetical protein